MLSQYLNTHKWPLKWVSENKSELLSQEQKQLRVLRSLISKASATRFGEEHDFQLLLQNPLSLINLFQKNVPISDYNKMHDEWWCQGHDKSGLTWPGKSKYYALSSGTSGAPSKHIPVTKDMLHVMTKNSIKQYRSITRMGLPTTFYNKGILMIGGCTDLQQIAPNQFEGDLSGILAKNMPIWSRFLYKPGKEIARQKDWSQKLAMIIENAPKWDVGSMVGVPAWLLLVIEKVIEKYKLNNIHEIWPNFQLIVHGGVSFVPYKEAFAKVMGKPMKYMETYLASEGFVAFRKEESDEGMSMILNNGIFYEFVPFNDENFDGNGELKENAKALTISQVEKGKEYAILMSTVSGLWRYLIGDTVKFTNVEKAQILITGRTKSFLSMCGEHLSVDNMNMAISQTAQDFGVVCKEYTVIGKSQGRAFSHHWYLGLDNTKINKQSFLEKLDEKLKALNDDYATERDHVLKDLTIELLPVSTFNNWMKAKNKMGGQHKFPRVLKGNLIAEWEDFVS
ncbi:MAG: GH3 auxin-responsive promoter family protein [Flavobacteriales bacterium]|nr:GH3 auxin-responsive promoter family protein [Flavobacteriales bacterium]